MCYLTTLFYTLHIPGSNWNSSDDQWFSIAGPQDCQYVFPLNIIYNALFLFRTLIPSTPSNVPMIGYCSYSHLIFPVLQFSSKRQKHTWRVLDCLHLIFVTFKPPASWSRTYCDCNPIRAFETFDISKEPIRSISKTSKFWMFWYKLGWWLSAIKGMALWSRGFSRGSLFLFRAWKACGTQGICWFN